MKGTTSKVKKFNGNCDFLILEILLNYFDGRVASCARDLTFKSRSGQILHSVANGSPSLQLLRK